MVKYNITQENIENTGIEDLPESLFSIEQTDVMTGDRERNRYLYYQLKRSIANAGQIDIVVAFLMESGVRLLLADLKKALDRGVKIRLLTGNYLGITQPWALYLIKGELGNRVDLRFYNEKHRSFHPKAYIFHGEKESEIYIGSSNISNSALTSGIEWNYRFGSRTDEKNFSLFYETFEELFEHHSVVIDDEELKRYSKHWHRPAVAKDLEQYDEEEKAADTAALESESHLKICEIFQPRGAQIEALYALRASREDGAKRGLVQAATGIGKTYLAAFDSKDYERVLFVAHREEILVQAAKTFYNVRQSDDYGFFNGKHKDTGKSVVFASAATLGKDKYLSEAYFLPEQFDYMIVDEFHHAVNEQYQKIISYFRPEFLLGLTATPERLDGRNIYELCDYNVPYEISLKEAINKGILVPFHYYGIFDKTDYSSLHLVKGRYLEQELNEKYINNESRYQLIYRYYKKYRSKRALGFCCSRVHAEAMAKDFSKRGIPAAAVYSNSADFFSEDRKQAVRKLEHGEIRVIFSVDMFNEGVDIPSVDMVMFLRPTESPVVFLQQLGRGLRRYRKKEYLTVLDFIGNYQKAANTPFLLSGQSYEKERIAKGEITEFEYPENCIVDFDLQLIDLFQEMAGKNQKIKERIEHEYFRVKELLNGKCPTRIDLFTCMEDEIYQICMNRPKENPFRHYLTYLWEHRELSEAEEMLYAGIGREFLNLLETTDMQKSYKMPVLLAFYNGGDMRMAVTKEELLASWKQFFSTGTNWKDLGCGCTYAEYREITDQQHLSNILKNPVRFLKLSGKGFFVEKEGYVIALRKELGGVIKQEAFIKHMKDLIEYRTIEYYRRRYTDTLNI